MEHTSGKCPHRLFWESFAILTKFLLQGLDGRASVGIKFD